MSVFILLFILHTDFKGVWVPRWSISDKDAIFTCLDGRFNHIFLQIFALGEAYYPSKYAPSKIQSDRWLKDFLDQAHRRGIEVSAWINVFYSWGFAPKMNNLRHPINRHPNWYVQDVFGRSVVDYSVDELRALGTSGYYLAPANAAVRSFLMNIAGEIMSNYDFDGIHLDYVRYPNSEFIYDVSLRSKFMRKHYVDPKDIFAEDELKTRVGLWGCDDLQKQWREFAHNDLTMFVRALNETLKNKKPGMQLSAAVKPDYLNARYEYYQDWIAWLDSGFVDFVCVMAYGKDIKKHLDKILKAVKEPGRVNVGLGLYALDPKEIEKQVNLVRSKPFSGVVFFSYDQLKKNQDYLHTLR